MCINCKCKGMHMPRLWPLSQSQVTAMWFHVCMCKGTETIQTPQIQLIIMQQSCTILFSKGLGSCSQVGRCFPLQIPHSQPCFGKNSKIKPQNGQDHHGQRAQGSSWGPFWHRGVWKGNGREEEHLNKSGSKLFDGVEQKVLQLFEISN